MRTRVAVLAALVAAAVAPAATADADRPFRAPFSGTFTITFGGCPVAPGDLLHFVGEGRVTHLGRSTIEGFSCSLPDPSDPLCTTILDLSVVVTAANGDTFRFVNQARDCLDFSTPGRTFLRGTGTYDVEPGTGRFADADGAGSVAVTAEILSLGPAGASGVFGPLLFEGGIAY